LLGAFSIGSAETFHMFLGMGDQRCAQRS